MGNEAERQQLLEPIVNGSIITWRHLNMLGEYDFSDEKLVDSFGIQLPKLQEEIEKLLEVMEKPGNDNIPFRIPLMEYFQSSPITCDC